MMLFFSERSLDHLTPAGHPESPERGDVLQAAALRGRDLGLTMREPRPASREAVLRVHAEDYVAMLEATRGKAVALDPDTFTSPLSVEAAWSAAGAAIDAAEYAIDGNTCALALVRPPGHHAERDKAMGFCLLGNAAIAAAHARAGGVGRVAVVDIDVHHGNGTQWTFYADPSVLFMSTHQFPFYPGTGAATEVGQGAGAGATLNVPLEAGATDADHALAWREVMCPVLEGFEPDLIIVSAGFDGHEDDPLASQRMTTAGFAGWMSALRWQAERLCKGRLSVVTEGGYDLEALRACLDGTVDVLRAPAGTARPWTQPAGDTRRGTTAVAQVRAAHPHFR
jgi:acetoin utilization deacetylase AcuC-like enzyme